MELLVRRWHLTPVLALLLVLVQWVWPCVCLTVEFPSKRPLSVALSRTLVLRATIKKTSEERVLDLAWNMVEGQTGLTFRVYPPARNARVSVEQDGATLRVLNLTKEDFGNYTITVTDDGGRQASARRTVTESEVAPRVSIPLLCEVSHDSEQWDIPKFVWLADGVEVPNSNHSLSADGSKLYPFETCVRNYTCTVSSSLGTSSNHFYNTSCNKNPDKPEPGGQDCTTPRVLVGILSAILVSVIIYCVWRKWHRNTDPPASIPEQRLNLQGASDADR
ncbi:uncharacterized protein LOC118213291 isoform X2 [Anguilla anguilla]|uniref:uncharacterized protein LOC118213291 isoform X2 n=1 Tax=Anguilla anguilla TaxID=7936 RepID=UPI0015A76838|nr:uncharacterized protein LOC118213291 isoform X2 [Anguilla anguilla]